MKQWHVDGKKPRKHVWITIHGKEIFVSKMTDKHLLNVIRMLRRWARDEAKAANAATPYDEEDAFVWEPDMFLKSVETFPALIEAMERRDLTELS